MKTNYPTKKLGDVLDYEQPTEYLVSSKDYKDEYLVPVLTAGKSFLLGNTNEKNGIFPKEKLPVIIFDDFTTAIKFVDFPFKVKSSAMKILHAKKNEADIRFLFYKMLTIKFAHDQHKRYWISECSNFKIPLPPLKIQKQIVERLDKIAEAQKLNDGLIQKTDELFQSLLHKELNPAGKNWEVKKLSDVCEEMFAGGDAPKNNFSKTRTETYTVPVFANGIEGKDLYGYTNIQKVTKPSVTISARGTIGYPVVRTEPFYPIVRLIVLIPNQKIVDVYFLHYASLNFRFFNTGTSIPQLTIPMIKNIKILIPPLEIQKQIVAKLSAVQDYKKQLLVQKSKLKELFDSALAHSMN